MPDPIRLLGLDFETLDQNGAAALIDSRGASAPFGYVVTPNADHFVRLNRAPHLRPLYHRATLRLLDSSVVAGAARLLGIPAPPVVTGSDLTARLIAGIAKGERITIIGMRQPAVEALAARCQLETPDHYDPPGGFEHDPAAFRRTVDFVLDHPARLIFLAVGSPRQEQLAAAIQQQTGVTGTALCIGAALEFLAGTSKRAPVWMRTARLEWLFRLGADPRRLARRYLLDDPPIFALLLRERLMMGAEQAVGSDPAKAAAPLL